MFKRVVLHVTKGPYAGLFQICGTEDQLIDSVKGTASDNHGQLPPFVRPVNCFDHEGSVSLVTTKARYHLYREIIAPAETAAPQTFHPDQQ